jgi:Salmonella virulence plasmid 65kDa B protein
MKKRLIAAVLLSLVNSLSAQYQGGDQPQSTSITLASYADVRRAADSGSSVLAESFSGTAAVKLPLEFPEGRNGVGPNITLFYRSSNSNGWLGVGWDLLPGVIERSSHKGIDYGSDSYVFRTDVNGSNELVGIGGDQYRPKIETGFARIAKIAGPQGPYWQVTDKSGVQYILGMSPAARVSNDADQSQIFRWRLEHVQDLDGNTVDYRYVIEEGSSYLAEITYGGNVNGLKSQYSIQFYLQPRSDAIFSFLPNFPIKQSRLLSGIDVLARNTRVRFYKFLYTRSSTTGRSLLTEVREYGRDSILDPNGEPTQKSPSRRLFALQPEQSSAFGSDNTESGSVDIGEARWWADVNGDGRADFCRLFTADIADKNQTRGGVFPRVSCLLSNGDGFDKTPIESGAIDPGFPSGRAWVDVNGDGKADYCRTGGSKESGWFGVECLLSTGKGFGPEITSHSVGSIDLGFDSGRAWVDVNGDGKVDYCRMGGSKESGWFGVECLLSAGNGFGPDITSHSVGNIDLGFDNGRAWVDVNGDGKADYCRTGGSKESGWFGVKCLLSTGNGFGPESPRNQSVASISVMRPHSRGPT